MHVTVMESKKKKKRGMVENVRLGGRDLRNYTHGHCAIVSSSLRGGVGPLRDCGFFLFLFLCASAGRGGTITVFVVDRTEHRTPNVPPPRSLREPRVLRRRCLSSSRGPFPHTFSYGCCAPQQVLAPSNSNPSHFATVRGSPVVGEAAAASQSDRAVARNTGSARLCVCVLGGGWGMHTARVPVGPPSIYPHRILCW